MRNGAHGGSANACERFTAGFTLRFGVFVALQARTAPAVVALSADGVFALLLLVVTPAAPRP